MAPTSSAKSFFYALAGWLITLVVPVVLLVASARLLMLPAVMVVEYTRPGFPDDSYGFTTQDRLTYAPLGIHYLLSDESIAFLERQTLPADKCFPPARAVCPMFRPNELQHMVDVKMVTQAVFSLALLAFGLSVVVSGCLIAAHRTVRLLLALQRGAFLTGLLVITIGIAVIVAWDMFFATFHSLFFTDGTWTFYYSDTLIRLYPEQFWTDASLAVGFLSLIGALILWVGAAYGIRSRTKGRHDPADSA